MSTGFPQVTSSLSQFLARPDIEESPAWELVEGCIAQKPMPTLFHSRLQRNLVNYINQHTQRFEAIQELRCVVPPYSPVPDISVVSVERLPEADGPLQGAPDWLIEIRSPDQGTLKLQSKILHCLGAQTQLAWLIDLARRQVWIWQGDDLPVIRSGVEVLPSLGNVPGLTVGDVVKMTGQR